MCMQPVQSCSGVVSPWPSVYCCTPARTLPLLTLLCNLPSGVPLLCCCYVVGFECMFTVFVAVCVQARGFNTGVMLQDLRAMRELGWREVWERVTKETLPHFGSTALADQVRCTRTHAHTHTHTHTHTCTHMHTHTYTHTHTHTHTCTHMHTHAYTHCEASSIAPKTIIVIITLLTQLCKDTCLCRDSCSRCDVHCFQDCLTYTFALMKRCFI